jgi:hypothetical protein
VGGQFAKANPDTVGAFVSGLRVRSTRRARALFRSPNEKGGRSRPSIGASLYGTARKPAGLT